MSQQRPVSPGTELIDLATDVQRLAAMSRGEEDAQLLQLHDIVDSLRKRLSVQPLTGVNETRRAELNRMSFSIWNAAVKLARPDRSDAVAQLVLSLRLTAYEVLHAVAVADLKANGKSESGEPGHDLNHVAAHFAEHLLGFALRIAWDCVTVDPCAQQTAQWLQRSQLPEHDTPQHAALTPKAACVHAFQWISLKAQQLMATGSCSVDQVDTIVKRMQQLLPQLADVSYVAFFADMCFNLGLEAFNSARDAAHTVSAVGLAWLRASHAAYAAPAWSTTSQPQASVVHRHGQSLRLFATHVLTQGAAAAPAQEDASALALEGLRCAEAAARIQPKHAAGLALLVRCTLQCKGATAAAEASGAACVAVLKRLCALDGTEGATGHGASVAAVTAHQLTACQALSEAGQGEAVCHALVHLLTRRTVDMGEEAAAAAAAIRDANGPTTADASSTADASTTTTTTASAPNTHLGRIALQCVNVALTTAHRNERSDAHVLRLAMQLLEAGRRGVPAYATAVPPTDGGAEWAVEPSPLDALPAAAIAVVGRVVGTDRLLATSLFHRAWDVAAHHFESGRLVPAWHWLRACAAALDPNDRDNRASCARLLARCALGVQALAAAATAANAAVTSDPTSPESLFLAFKVHVAQHDEGAMRRVISRLLQVDASAGSRTYLRLVAQEALDTGHGAAALLALEHLLYSALGIRMGHSGDGSEGAASAADAAAAAAAATTHHHQAAGPDVIHVPSLLRHLILLHERVHSDASSTEESAGSGGGAVAAVADAEASLRHRLRFLEAGVNYWCAQSSTGDTMEVLWLHGAIINFALDQRAQLRWALAEAAFALGQRIAVMIPLDRDPQRAQVLAMLGTLQCRMELLATSPSCDTAALLSQVERAQAGVASVASGTGADATHLQWLRLLLLWRFRIVLRASTPASPGTDVTVTIARLKEEQDGVVTTDLWEALANVCLHHNPPDYNGGIHLLHAAVDSCGGDHDLQRAASVLRESVRLSIEAGLENAAILQLDQAHEVVTESRLQYPNVELECASRLDRANAYLSRAIRLMQCKAQSMMTKQDSDMRASYAAVMEASKASGSVVVTTLIASHIMRVRDLDKRLLSKLTVKLDAFVKALQAQSGVDSPVIGVDVRLIMRRVYHNRAAAPDWSALAGAVIQHVHPWVVHGCRVVLVDHGQAGKGQAVAPFVRRAHAARERNAALQHICAANALYAQPVGEEGLGEDGCPVAVQSHMDHHATKANRMWRVELSSALSDAVEQCARQKYGEREVMAYVRAPFHASSQLVNMLLEGKCHAIVSMDGDCLVRGCGFMVHPFQLKEVQKKRGPSQVTLAYVGALPGAILEPLGVSPPPPVHENGVRFAALPLPARVACATLAGNGVLPYSLRGFGSVVCAKLLQGRSFDALDAGASVADVVEHALSYERRQREADAHRTTKPLEEFEQRQSHPMLRHCRLSPDSALVDASDDGDASAHVSDAPDAFRDDTDDGVFLCHSGHVAWRYSGPMTCATCGMTLCRPCFLGTASQEVEDAPSMCVGCESSVAFVVTGPLPDPAALHVPSDAERCLDALLARADVRTMVHRDCRRPPKDGDAARMVVQRLLTQKLAALAADSETRMLLEHFPVTSDVAAGVLQAIKDMATERSDWPVPSDTTVAVPISPLLLGTNLPRSDEGLFILDLLRGIGTRFGAGQQHDLMHLNAKHLYGPYVLDSIAHARPLLAGAQRLLCMGTRTCVTSWADPFAEHMCAVVKREREALLHVVARIHSSSSEAEWMAPAQPHEVVVYLSRSKMVRSFCTCQAGNATCHHAVAVVLQLQLAAMSVSWFVADTLNACLGGLRRPASKYSKTLAAVAECIYGRQRGRLMSRDRYNAPKELPLVERLPRTDYHLFVDVFKEIRLTAWDSTWDVNKFLIKESNAPDDDEQQEQQLSLGDHVANDDAYDNDDNDYCGDSDSADDGNDDDVIGVQRHRFTQKCYWSRTYRVPRNFWSRDGDGNITFNYLGFLQRWKGKTADPRGQGPHKRAFFTDTPLFWTIAVRAIREHPKAAFEALQHWIHHDDDLMRILTDNADEATTGGAGAEAIPEVDTVQGAVPAPAGGEASRPRDAGDEAAANTRPQKKPRQGSRRRCNFVHRGERCGHRKGSGECTSERWKSLPKLWVPAGQTWEDVDPVKLKAKVAKINTERRKCGLKPVVARSLAADKKTVLNMEAIVNDAKRQHRVCGCHLVDGKVAQYGPKHVTRPAKTRSKGTARARCVRRVMGVELDGAEAGASPSSGPADDAPVVLAGWEFPNGVPEPIAELWRMRNDLLRQKAEAEAQLAAANARVEMATKGVKYCNVKDNHDWWSNNTHFSCSRHFDMFIDFVTDGDPEMLRMLHMYVGSSFKPGQGYTMPTARQFGQRDTDDIRTEFIMYFAFEVAKESTVDFFDRYFVEAGQGLRVVRSYAVLMHEFSEAFGRILSWQEQAVMMPTQWREWFGLDQAPVDARRPWDPAAVTRGGCLRRPCVMETTNVAFSCDPRCEEPLVQSSNRYHSGSVAKAAVCALPLGWVYAPRFMAGAVCDSVFAVRSGVAEMQHKQAQADGGPPFATVADEGKRQRASLWKCGEQTLVTPTSGPDGWSLATLRRVCAAKWRILNASAIARVMTSRFGVGQSWKMDPELMELLWRNYVFRCNAVYTPYSREVWEDARARVLRFASAAYLAEQGAAGPEASS